jgi:hypothetical protein
MTVPFAYFDPGNGSLLLQAIVGGTSGLLVLARLLWQEFIRGRERNPAASNIAQSSIRPLAAFSDTSCLKTRANEDLTQGEISGKTTTSIVD